MRLSTKAMATALGLLWGGCMLFTGLVNMASPSYGLQFLNVMSSVYPGYRGTPALGDVLIGTAYGFLDGAIAGWLLAWLYNFVALQRSRPVQHVDTPVGKAA